MGIVHLSVTGHCVASHSRVLMSFNGMYGRILARNGSSVQFAQNDSCARITCRNIKKLMRGTKINRDYLDVIEFEVIIEK